MQTQVEPISIGGMICDADREMRTAFVLMMKILTTSQSKREIIAAFETFEEGYNACADLADRALALAIASDPGAAPEDIADLTGKVRVITLCWSEMLLHVVWHRGIRREWMN